jgi:hypothetical protein
MRLDSALKKCRPQYISAQKISTLFDALDEREHSGVEKYFGQAQAQGFLNFFNPSPVSDLPSPNL